MNKQISELVHYGIKNGLVDEEDKIYVINKLLELFGKEDFVWVETEPRVLSEILNDLTVAG